MCGGKYFSEFFLTEETFGVTTINAGKNMDSIVNATIYCEVGF